LSGCLDLASTAVDLRLKVTNSLFQIFDLSLLFEVVGLLKSGSIAVLFNLLLKRHHLLFHLRNGGFGVLNLRFVN